MKRAFGMKQKTFFMIFKGLSVAKNCLRPESEPLKNRKERTTRREGRDNLLVGKWQRLRLNKEFVS